MRLLLEISDKDLGLGGAERYDKSYKLRKAARVVLINSEGKIAFQHISRDGFYKLPGGGLEEGEDIITGLKREVREEVGCDLEVTGEVGMIIEYREKYELIQISYCYFGAVKGEVGTPKLDEAEVAEGLLPIWVTLDEAISLVESSKPKKYEGNFIIVRDLAMLKEAKKLLKTA